eukprot:scaffold5022_cov224-Pinguiococcus_pyrenoidosus.AAC.3
MRESRWSIGSGSRVSAMPPAPTCLAPPAGAEAPPPCMFLRYSSKEGTRPCGIQRRERVSAQVQVRLLHAAGASARGALVLPATRKPQAARRQRGRRPGAPRGLGAAGEELYLAEEGLGTCDPGRREGHDGRAEHDGEQGDGAEHAEVLAKQALQRRLVERRQSCKTRQFLQRLASWGREVQKSRKACVRELRTNTYVRSSGFKWEG